MPDGSIRTTHPMPGGRTAVVTQHTTATGTVKTTSLGPGHIAVEKQVYGHPNLIRISRRVGDRSTAVIYRRFSYRGIEYARPVPVYVYGPEFYAWGLRPWDGTVVYGWGWQAQPWYVVYGGVFTPYPTYAGLNFWLTDYIIAANLQEDYAAANAVSPAPAAMDNQQPPADPAEVAPPPVTPEMKEEIAAQVKVEIAEQQQAAAGGASALAGPPSGGVTEDTPDALRPGHTIFRVVAPLSVMADGQACSLNPDDYITRSGALNDDGTVTVKVKASRSADCPQGATTNVALNDLMAMEGAQQERINDGLQLASKNIGTNGLPAGPPPQATPVPGGQAVPDPGLSDTLKQQRSAVSIERENTVQANLGQ